MDIFEAEMVRRFVVAVEKIANALDHKTESWTSGVVWTEDAIKNEPKAYTTWVSTDEPQTDCPFGEDDKCFGCGDNTKCVVFDEPQRGCDADCTEDCNECAKETELWTAEQTEPQTVLEMVLDRQTDEDRRKMAESVRKAIKDEPQTERIE